MNNGAQQLKRKADSVGGVRELARRLEMYEGTLSRHMTGRQVPTYEFRMFYQEKLCIHHEAFSRKPRKIRTLP
jgi:hypothetical protein